MAAQHDLRAAIVATVIAASMLAAAAAVPSPSICPGAVSKDLLSELIEQESTK